MAIETVFKLRRGDFELDLAGFSFAQTKELLERVAELLSGVPDGEGEADEGSHLESIENKEPKRSTKKQRNFLNSKPEGNLYR